MSTPLSNLCAASEERLYLTLFPIIASGLKKAHSTRTFFVFVEHPVDIPPITPARLMISLLTEKMQFLPLSLMSEPKSVLKDSSAFLFSKINWWLMVFESKQWVG